MYALKQGPLRRSWYFLSWLLPLQCRSGLALLGMFELLNENLWKQTQPVIQTEQHAKGVKKPQAYMWVYSQTHIKILYAGSYQMETSARLLQHHDSYIHIRSQLLLKPGVRPV